MPTVRGQVLLGLHVQEPARRPAGRESALLQAANGAGHDAHDAGAGVGVVVARRGVVGALRRQADRIRDGGAVGGGAAHPGLRVRPAAAGGGTQRQVGEALHGCEQLAGGRVRGEHEPRVALVGTVDEVGEAPGLVVLVEGEARHVLDDEGVEVLGQAEVVVGVQRCSAELPEGEAAHTSCGVGHLQRPAPRDWHGRPRPCRAR
mmetsp:Transcript_116408/g.325602  ORF Transcript_116408/g.325602 Transcript_116408/m.325602 type:complete len:204 (-) Transcript_116408:72-683(-)